MGDVAVQVADGVLRLGTRVHSFYLVTEGEGATLVDAGCSGEWGALEAALEQARLPLSALAGVVVTHAHADHFGLAKRLADADVPVTVHAEERTRALGTYEGRYAVGATELPIYRPTVLRNMLPLVVKGVMRLDHLDDVATVDDGEALDLPGRPVVVHTPGHTEGHVMLHCPDRGVLFTGDGLVTLDLLSGDTGPGMLDRRFHLDLDQATTSLDRIVDLDADLLLPGHGEPWRGSPRDAVAAVRARGR